MGSSAGSSPAITNASPCSNLISITFFFFIGGAFAGLIRLELLTPQPDLVASDTYNKFFTMHGIIMIFLFLVPSVPATLGNFLIPIMLGATRPRLPKDQPAQLVPVPRRRHLHAGRPGARRSRYRVDLHHAALDPLPQHPRRYRRDCDLHRWLQLHLHRAQLHRDHPPHAGPRDDLVPHATLRLVELRCFDPDGARHASPRDRHRSRSAGTDDRHRCLRSQPRAATRCSSSISSGSTRTLPSTS